MGDYLDYLFDNEYKQRQDINRLGRQQRGLESEMSSVESRLEQLTWTVEQLSATVRVLMRTLAATTALDVAAIKAGVTAEIAQARAEATAHQPCGNCGKPIAADQAVRLGSDVWCRDCARNA